jgi:hypothetical protein
MEERGCAMRQLVYALRFTGRATRASPDGNILALSATAPGVTLVSVVSPTGLTANLEPMPGAEAVFASEVTVTGATSFQEIGTITFGEGQRLRFATVGSGYLGPSQIGQQGAAVWRVEGGEGQFIGARGLITAHLTVSTDLTVIGHHLGIIVLR